LQRRARPGFPLTSRQRRNVQQSITISAPKIAKIPRNVALTLRDVEMLKIWFALAKGNIADRTNKVAMISRKVTEI